MGGAEIIIAPSPLVAWSGDVDVQLLLRIARVTEWDGVKYNTVRLVRLAMAADSADQDTSDLTCVQCYLR